jgi:nicotinate-nucleotide adenylyltransferase
MDRIGVFGGTFNPPHLGHLKLVSETADRLELDRVIIIPAFLPPHKEAKLLACGEDRLEMCRLTFGEDSRFQVSAMEIERGGKSYTYDTLCELRMYFPHSELFLIIGSDMLLTFEKWHRYEDILNLCTVCAAERDSEQNPIKKHGLPKIFEGHNLILTEFSPVNISSSKIRQMIRSSQDIGGVVTQEVKRYIDDRKLYLEGL